MTALRVGDHVTVPAFADNRVYVVEAVEPDPFFVTGFAVTARCVTLWDWTVKGDADNFARAAEEDQEPRFSEDRAPEWNEP